MNKKQKSRVTIGAAVLLSITLAITGYLWFKPHRDVQRSKVFATVTVKELINEFSLDVAAANKKYLSADGNSKVLEVDGIVHNITKNQNSETVIVLMEQGSNVGVSATFLKNNSEMASALKPGDHIKVKGAITAGSSYDADLDLYEHVVLIQCSLK